MLKIIPPVYSQTDWESGRCVQTLRDGGTFWHPRVGAQRFDDIATIHGLECLFYNILQVITIIAGLVFLFMFISGGYSYLFSGGDEKKVAQASATLGSSILGLVGIIVSWLILRFIQNFTGVNVIDFIIPSMLTT